MRNNKWYDENKDKILNLYYQNKKIKDICDILNCNSAMLYKKFNEWNITRRKRIQINPRYNAIYKINYHYFDDINNEHKAYWMGLLLADGFVNDKEIYLCLQRNDMYLIEDFLKDLESNHQIKFNKDNNPYVCICCKMLSQKLIEYGFHNHKSWYIDINKILSYIPSELESHFIRGMFDGDRCIKYYKYYYLKTVQYHFGYTGTYEVCKYLKNKFNINRKLVFEGNKTYTLVTRDVNKINFINQYLYNNATIFLKRKRQTFEKINMMTFNDYNKAIS